MTDSGLFDARVALLRLFMEDAGLGGLLLSRCDNFAMATGGKRNYVSVGTDTGANSLFVPLHGPVCVVANAIEAPRQTHEEMRGLDCEVLTHPWHAGSAAEAVASRFQGTFASDDGTLGPNVHNALAGLRSLLTPLEIEKYRRLGRLAADAVVATLKAVEPGMAEADIAARLVCEGWKRRCRVPVALVAADERIARFRHPLPTESPLNQGALEERRVERYVMVVGGFVREGLVVSLTRFCAVDTLPDRIVADHARICAVDALMQACTRPGKTLGDVLAAARTGYVDFGFSPSEWENHHQGGATGYAGRTAKAVPESPFPVLDRSWSTRLSDRMGETVPLGSAFAWNPSAPGVKSEDTFLLLPDGEQEIVSTTPSLPEVDTGTVKKSGILMRQAAARVRERDSLQDCL